MQIDQLDSDRMVARRLHRLAVCAGLFACLVGTVGYAPPPIIGASPRSIKPVRAAVLNFFTAVGGFARADVRELCPFAVGHRPPPTVHTAPAVSSSRSRSSADPLMAVMTTPRDDNIITLSDGDRLATDIKVAVFGGGSFGTAMACVLGRKGVPCTLVVRKADVVEQINENHVNPYYQSDLLLPSAVRATLDP